MIEVKNVDKPDERRDFPKGHLEVCNLTGLSFGVATFEPGWKWSECVKPIAGTELCEVHHNGLVLKGTLRVRMSDGTEADVGPGDLMVVPPGHDAWVVGDEQVVAYDFAGGAADYAKAASG
ncbi:cupin domain-containing protein [Nonomuraea sp. NPDC050556]|uniref:cupin domain-containing protein n=1 Tax=Nonomuraea sp. NPDC050556 TaxID=3364369 RepID=UPI0037B0CBB4